MSAHDQLLVVIDPVARRIDGESVRIAKDVLCAGAAAKICLPDGPEEFSRALTRRGGRRPVVVGDDQALLRAVAALYRGRELGDEPLSLVPVGSAASVELARSLGVPTGAVAAARAVLDGVARPLDLLVDDSDGVVLGELCIPAEAAAAVSVPHPASVWDTCRSFVRTLVRPAPPAPVARPHRLRVEADGVLLSDLDEPVEDVRVRAGDGAAEVTVTHPRRTGAEPLRTLAKVVTVSGPSFRYRADTLDLGPVRHRTWTLRPKGWALTLPAAGPRE
ncbi:diacylglycerol kinase [Streptomyces sp. FIT100]|uniref:diacylglycerol kinase n=1 Tax=Streptomyces sp. FIT100 TaxID=2837956 RepID=UPI0021C7760C|nr:diacylglycerol kinase [Streptomyces sp. FIT100]UUN28260.1 diacylglycerol kinase [Streptomyces sp. FIT100]